MEKIKWPNPECPICHSGEVEEIGENINFMEDLLDKNYECSKCGIQFVIQFAPVKVV